MKNTHGGVLILLKLTLLKLTLLHGCFSRFLNCANGTKSRNVSHTCVLMNFELHSSYKEFQNLLKRDLDSEVSNDTKFVWNGKEAAVNENNELDFLLKPEVSGPEQFQRRFYKMIKHIQTIRWQFVDELFECV